MKLLITGATGLVGSEIVNQCHQLGYSVNYLSRDKENLEQKPNHKGFHWDISKKEIDPTCLEDVNVIIHLAGAPISERWTTSYKKTILDSRIESAKLLHQLLEDTPNQVEHFISASAIGIYPSSLMNFYTEDYEHTSSSFLGEVVEAWEAAVDTFKSLNINVSKIRTGLVLDKNEGALPAIAKPVMFGLGAPLGSGQQWQSWIHVRDLASMYLHVLNNELEGVYNGVAPTPETNKDLTEWVAKVLGKPFFMPRVPKFVLKLILGEMHTIVVESQRVSSQKIEDEGFNFEFYKLPAALIDIYND
jgi:uncharacterized protein (TIGR01777 family)